MCVCVCVRVCVCVCTFIELFSIKTFRLALTLIVLRKALQTSTFGLLGAGGVASLPPATAQVVVAGVTLLRQDHAVLPQTALPHFRAVCVPGSNTYTTGTVDHLKN